jgi:hypothetical protein
MRSLYLIILILATLALCILVGAASADQIQKRIAYRSIVAGAADTTQAYALPSGASALEVHWEAFAPKVSFTLQYKSGAGAWTTAWADTKLNSVWATLKTMIVGEWAVIEGDLPSSMQVRAIFANTHASIPARNVLAYIRYTEPDEQH